ncbi:MAG: response regulator, partial [Phycisphaerae bacterium]|nr:response regulator [Saprospiraceae bacterium]
GFPEEKIGQIFDRFYQVDNSATRAQEGTGIGLTLTKELIRIMGGEISVSSKKSVGTTFVVTIPITTHSQLAEGATPAIPIPLPIKKIPRPAPAFENPEKPLLLVVEDNDDVREYLIDCVKDQYQVVEAHNGQMGIEMAIELIPDLIVSDVMMPEKDGFELCQTLKNDERTSHIPLVLLTAKADVSSRIEGLSRGADDYIAKPFDRTELEIRLRNLVENRRRLKSRYASLPLPPASEDPDLKLEDAFLLKIRDVVEAHLSDSDFEMPQLERALGMSRSQIFRKVKALTDQPPTLFIRSIRLFKAKELLQTSRLTIAEVAYEVGFTTPSYFSTAFLEEFGKNPSDFR